MYEQGRGIETVRGRRGARDEFRTSTAKAATRRAEQRERVWPSLYYRQTKTMAAKGDRVGGEGELGEGDARRVREKANERVTRWD